MKKNMKRKTSSVRNSGKKEDGPSSHKLKKTKANEEDFQDEGKNPKFQI